MRSREQITRDMLTAARPTDSDKYPLRQLKAELLVAELLIDVRDLLVEIRDQKKDTTVRKVTVHDSPPTPDP